MPTLRVALLQLASHGADVETALREGERWCRTAADLRADVAVFPEMWQLGYQACPIDAAGRDAWCALATDEDGPFVGHFRRLAAQQGVDLATVQGTGVGGRIRKEDVLKAAEAAAAPAAQPAASAAPAASPKPEVSPLRGTTQPMSRLRKVIAERAVATARISKPLTPHRVELADEPVHAGETWVSAYDVDPFDVDEAERQGRMLELSAALLAGEGVSHTSASLHVVRENKFFANLAGTSTTTGDGGMTPEERTHSSLLVYQCLPSRYGMNPDDLRRADAIEVVVGQGAKPGGGGEYPTQDGFGWTNGVVSALLERYPDLRVGPPAAP